MPIHAVSLHHIADFLRTEFAVDRYPIGERGGIYHPSDSPINRLGLALEPFPALPKWVADKRIDALWLHRPWQLDPETLPPDVGILHHHLPFDETLTMGFNTQLASLLGAIGAAEPLGHKRATTEAGEVLPPRAIGMLFDIDEQEFDSGLHTIKTQFGGYDRAETGRHATVGRVAVVGAMNDALIREAVSRGASLYVTGQYRKPAQEAVDQTGIAVVAVGHRRTEEWGLRALADRLRQRWPELELLVRGN